MLLLLALIRSRPSANRLTREAGQAQSMSPPILDASGPPFQMPPGWLLAQTEELQETVRSIIPRCPIRALL